MVHGRGNNVVNALLSQLRQIATRLDFVEIAQRRGAHLDDISDDEEVPPKHNPELEEDQDEERLLRVLFREHSKPTIEVVPYRKLDTNTMLDWISDMDKLFEYEYCSYQVERSCFIMVGTFENLQTKERKGENQNLVEDGEKGKEQIPSC